MADSSNLPAISGDRTATLHRKTGETEIRLSINLDGAGVYDVDTGNGFLDHMVSQISRHGLIDITLKADGDLHTGWHHLVEDVGITLGRAFNEAIGDARGIRRMGHAIVPLDETLAMVALDCSGRGYAVIETTIGRFYGGNLARLAGAPLLRVLGTGRARSTSTPGYSPASTPTTRQRPCARRRLAPLRDALEPDPRSPHAVPSTKGTLSD